MIPLCLFSLLFCSERNKGKGKYENVFKDTVTCRVLGNVYSKRDVKAIIFLLL